MSEPPLTPAEWKVMDAVWRVAPGTVREVVEALGEDADWAYTTVKTMMDRLAAKGVLESRRSGPVRVYRPALTRDDARRSAALALVDRAFGGAAAPLVGHLVRAGGLSDAERAELRRLLERPGDGPTRSETTMSSVHGVWRHEMAMGPGSVVTTQTIRRDGSYETHMVYRSGAGCVQHIRHHGRVTVGEAELKLTLDRGETRMRGCEDPSENFDVRDFTAEETEEARGLLARPIPYVVDGDTLTTTVEGPGGPMEVVYQRQESP